MNEDRLPIKHELKSDPDGFQALMRGVKTSEVRRNDRDFRIGDSVELRETRYPAHLMRFDDGLYPLLFTGTMLTKVISHIQTGHGLPDGLVVLSFEQGGQRSFK